MPLFSRMGPYDTDAAATGPRERRAAAAGRVLGARRGVHAGRAVAGACSTGWRRYRDQRARVDGVAGASRSSATSLLAEVAERGAVTARDLDDGLPRDKEHWGWNWSETKKALDYLFTGRRAGRRRPQQPVRACSTTCPSGCCRPTCWPPRRRRRARPTVELVRRAAPSPRRGHRALPARLLPDARRARPGRRSPTLVEAGELLPVRVEGWNRPAYLHRDAAPAAPGRRPGAAQPVRPGGVGARAHRAAVRLPLPHRDLRAGAASGCTATTCCRSCSATGSSAGSTSRPTGGPAALRVLGVVRRARTPPRTRPRSWPSELRRLAGWLGLDGDRRRAAGRPRARAGAAVAARHVLRTWLRIRT